MFVFISYHVVFFVFIYVKWHFIYLIMCCVLIYVSVINHAILVMFHNLTLCRCFNYNSYFIRIQSCLVFSCVVFNFIFVMSCFKLLSHVLFYSFFLFYYLFLPLLFLFLLSLLLLSFLISMGPRPILWGPILSPASSKFGPNSGPKHARTQHKQVCLTSPKRPNANRPQQSRPKPAEPLHSHQARLHASGHPHASRPAAFPLSLPRTRPAWPSRPGDQETTYTCPVRPLAHTDPTNRSGPHLHELHDQLLPQAEPPVASTSSHMPSDLTAQPHFELPRETAPYTPAMSSSLPSASSPSCTPRTHLEAALLPASRPTGIAPKRQLSLQHPAHLRICQPADTVVTASGHCSSSQPRHTTAWLCSTSQTATVSSQQPQALASSFQQPVHLSAYSLPQQLHAWLQSPLHAQDLQATAHAGITPPSRYKKAGRLWFKGWLLQSRKREKKRKHWQTKRKRKGQNLLAEGENKQRFLEEGIKKI